MNKKNIIIITTKEPVKVFPQNRKKKVVIGNKLLNFYENDVSIFRKVLFNYFGDGEFKFDQKKLEDLTTEKKLHPGLRTHSSDKDRFINILIENKKELNPTFIASLKLNLLNVLADKQYIYTLDDNSVFIYQCKKEEDVFDVNNFIWSLFNDIKRYFNLNNQDNRFIFILHKNDIDQYRTNSLKNKELVDKNRSFINLFKINPDNIEQDNICYTFSHEDSFNYNILTDSKIFENKNPTETCADIISNKIINKREIDLLEIDLIKNTEKWDVEIFRKIFSK